MASSLESRVRALEEQNMALMRTLQNVAQRTAAPMIPRLGRHLAKLDETLLPEGEANATMQVWSRGVLADGPVIRIKDLQLQSGQSLAADTKLWIVWDKTIWTWLCRHKTESDDHYAWLIGFTISNSTGGLMKANNDQMLATVDYIIDGNTPPVNGSSEILVHDDQEVCPNAIAGGMGWAFRNEHLGSEENPYYQILTCNQMCRQARAVLAQTMDGTQLEVAIQEFFPDDESPEGLDAIAPFRNFALNPQKRMARNGTPVRLRWGNVISPQGVPRQGYIIEDVFHRGLDVPINFRITSDKKIEVQYVRMAVESSVDEVANQPWTEMFPNKNCT